MFSHFFEECGLISRSTSIFAKGTPRPTENVARSCKIKGPRETEHSKFRDSEKRLEMISKTTDESSGNERGDNIEKISMVFKSS